MIGLSSTPEFACKRPKSPVATGFGSPDQKDNGSYWGWVGTRSSKTECKGGVDVEDGARKRGKRAED